MNSSMSSNSLCFSIVACTMILISGCGESGKPAGESKVVERPALVFSVVVNNAPHFESETGWGPGYVTARALAKGNGVIVGPDNKNVFAQNISVKPGEPFKIVAKASSVVNPQAEGRLQINWHDKDAKYISTSSQIITVSQDEKTFEYETVAPSEAVAGILYVTPQGPSDTIRYTEMILLKPQ